MRASSRPWGGAARARPRAPAGVRAHLLGAEADLLQGERRVAGALEVLDAEADLLELLGGETGRLELLDRVADRVQLDEREAVVAQLGGGDAARLEVLGREPDRLELRAEAARAEQSPGHAGARRGRRQRLNGLMAKFVINTLPKSSEVRAAMIVQRMWQKAMMRLSVLQARSESINKAALEIEQRTLEAGRRSNTHTMRAAARQH